MASDDIDLNADGGPAAGGGGGPRWDASGAGVNGAGGVVDDAEGSVDVVVGRIAGEEEGVGGGAARGEAGRVVGDREGGEEVGAGTSDGELVEGVEEDSLAGGRDLRTVEVDAVEGVPSAADLRSSSRTQEVDDPYVSHSHGGEEAAEKKPNGCQDVTEHTSGIRVGAPPIEDCKVPVNAVSSKDGHVSLTKVDDLGCTGTCQAEPSDSQPMEFVGEDTSPGDRDRPAVERAVSELEASALKESGTEDTGVGFNAPLVKECKAPVTSEPFENEHASILGVSDLACTAPCEPEPSGSQSLELVREDVCTGGRCPPAVEAEVVESDASAPRESSIFVKVCSSYPCGDGTSMQPGEINDGTEEFIAEDLKKLDVEVMELSENIEEPSVNNGTAGLGISPPENVESAQHFVLNKKKDGFSVSDLVWGKIKSHPWWPGQIVDPSNASEMALKHQRKDNFLVAYFGDKTFAWCDESQLRPFQSFFSQMEKQSSSEVFLDAVSDAVEEVSRRVQLAMVCPCVPVNSYSELKYQVIENAGIRKGISISVSDWTLGLLSFQPSDFLGYINSLAMFPTGNVDKMILSMAQAQLMSFYRSKGCTRLHVLFSGQDITGDQADSFPSTGKELSIKTIEHLSTIHISSEKMPSAITSCRGRPKSRSDISHKPRNIPEDGRKQKSLAQLMEDGRDAHSLDDEEGGPTDKVAHKFAMNQGDVELKHSSPGLNKSFKLGDCISRVATKLIGSSPMPEYNDEPNSKNTLLNFGLESDNPFGLDVSLPSQEEIQIVKSILLEDCSSLSGMLSQLCAAAINPIEKHDFLSTTITFFMELQRLRDSNTLEGLNSPGKVGRKRGRPKLVPSPGSAENTKLPENVPRKRGRPPKSLPESSPVGNRVLPERTGRKRGRPKKNPDSVHADKKIPERVPLPNISELSLERGPHHMKDSYWTDMVIHENPEKKRRGRKRKEECLLESVSKKSKPIMEPSKNASDITQHMCPSIINFNRSQALSSSKQVKYFGKKSMDMSTPTALILSFSHPDSVPSKTDLLRIFSHYGPLKEAETSVKTNCATVVFKKQADAEAAFSGAGKCSVFGSSLLSYRLKNIPSSSVNFPEAIPVAEKHSNSISCDAHEASGSKDIEERAPNLHLEVAGVVSDKKIIDDSNIDVLNQKCSTVKEICSVENVVSEKNELSDRCNLKVPTSSVLEVEGNEKSESLLDEIYLEVLEAKPDKLPVKKCDVDVAKPDVLMNSCIIDGTKQDDVPLKSCEMAGSGDAEQEYTDRGDYGGVVVHGEMSVSSTGWEITDNISDGRFMDSDHIDVLARNNPTSMETCNVETSVSENDMQPLDGGHLKVQGGKPSDIPADGICFNTFCNKNDSATVVAGDLDIESETRDETPSNQGDTESPVTNLKTTPSCVGISGDPEVKGNCHMAFQEEKQASSHKLEMAGSVVAEGPSDSDRVESQTSDALEPMNVVTEKVTIPPDVIDSNVLGRKQHVALSKDGCLDDLVCGMKVQDCKVDETLADDGKSRVLVNKQDGTLIASDGLVGFEVLQDPSLVGVYSVVAEGENSVNPFRVSDTVMVDRPTDSDNIEVPIKNDPELVGGCKADIPVAEKDKLPLEGDSLNVLDCMPHEASVSRISMEASNTTKDCASEGLCDVEIHGQKGDSIPGGPVFEVQEMEQDQITNVNDNVIGNLQKDSVSDCHLGDIQIGSDASPPTIKDVEFVSSCKAAIPAERDKFHSEGDKLKALDCTSHETPVSGIFMEASNTTKDSASVGICDVEVHGHKGDNTLGHSGVEFQGTEQDQVINVSGDMVGNLQEDPGSDCLVGDRQIRSDISLQVFSNKNPMGLTKIETSSGSMVASHAKMNPASIDVGTTQHSNVGSEKSFLHHLDIVTANTDDSPIICGNMEVSSSGVDETPKNGRVEDDLVCKTSDVSDSKSKKISDKYETADLDSHKDVLECGRISQNRESSNV